MVFSKSAFAISPQFRLIGRFLIMPISESTSQKFLGNFISLEELKKVAEPYILHKRWIRIDFQDTRTLSSLRFLQLLKHFVLVRGLTRWLISKFGETEEIRKSAYKLNRWQILKLIVTDYKTSKFQYLSKVKVQCNFSTNVEHPFVDSSILVNQDSALKINTQNQVCFSLGRESRIMFLVVSNGFKLENVFVSILNNKYLNRRLVRKYLHFIRNMDKPQTMLPETLKKIFNLNLENNYKNRKYISILPGGNENYDAVKLRELKYTLLNNVELWHQRFIVKNDLWILTDATYNPKYGFVAGVSHFIETSKKSEYITFTDPGKHKVQIEKGIFLSGRADENWFHFIFDTLARIQFLEGIDQDIPLLIRSGLPDSAKDLLFQFTKRQLFELDSETVYSVRNLFAVSARGMIYDNEVESEVARVDIPNSIKYLVERAVEFNDSYANEVLPIRIYFTRKSAYRNILNNDSIIRKLRRFGFENIDTDDDFIKKQQSYFKQAEVVVTPGGAVLGNLIFMPEGRKVVVFRSWYGGDLNLWRDLCKVLGHEYFEIVGIPIFYGLKTEKKLHSDYFVPLRYLNFLSSI